MIERDVQELLARVATLERKVAFLEEQLHMKAPDEVGVPAHVLALVRAGNKLGAIKALREKTGADLATAKKMIDSL